MKTTLTKKHLIRTAEKYDSYQNAWDRVFLAIKSGFFLEAIAIQESIITDRLVCFLAHLGLMTPKGSPSFKSVIDQWRRHFLGPIRIKRELDLQGAIDQWRRDRNCALHGFVKDAPVADFLLAAEQAANWGARLASYTCEWCAKELRARNLAKAHRSIASDYVI